MVKLFFIVVVLGISLWISSVYISDEVAHQHIKEYVAQSGSVSDATRSVKSLATLGSTAIQEQFKIADSMLQQARQTSDASLIMQAADQFSQILKNDPNNLGALQKLAKLSLDFGVSERAVSYYARYLEMEPRDIQAGIGYAIALAQSNQKESALKVIDQLKANYPDSSTAQLTKELVYRINGERPNVSEQLDNVIRSLPIDEETKSIVSEFLR